MLRINRIIATYAMTIVYGLIRYFGLHFFPVCSCNQLTIEVIKEMFLFKENYTKQFLRKT